MRKPKWYNWTGDAGWDDYCRMAWLVIFAPGLIMFGMMALSLFTGHVRLEP